VHSKGHRIKSWMGAGRCRGWYGSLVHKYWN